VGRVIGKRGENVTKIGQSCGCKIQIVQDVTPCRAEISGQQDRIYQAQRMIQEILSNPDPHAIVSLNSNQGFGGHHPGGHHAGGYRGGGNPNPHHGHAHGQGQGQGQGLGHPAGGMNPNPYMQMMNPYMQQMMGAQQQQQQQQQQQMGGYPAQGHQLRGPNPNPNPQLGYINPMQQQQQQQQQQHHAYGAMAAAAYAPGLSNIAGGVGGGGGGGASIWSEYKTDDGTPYWHNKVTDKTQWERPY